MEPERKGRLRPDRGLRHTPASPPPAAPPQGQNWSEEQPLRLAALRVQIRRGATYFSLSSLAGRPRRAVLAVELTSRGWKTKGKVENHLPCKRRCSPKIPSCEAAALGRRGTVWFLRGCSTVAMRGTQCCGQLGSCHLCKGPRPLGCCTLIAPGLLQPLFLPWPPAGSRLCAEPCLRARNPPPTLLSATGLNDERRYWCRKAPGG